MKPMLAFLQIVALAVGTPSYAQDTIWSEQKNVQVEIHKRQYFTDEEEQSASTTTKPKVHHAEPLYVDLIRDLGALKGEKEWNVAMGATNKDGFVAYEALVEYEWAAIDRLGIEIELPASFYSRQGMSPTSSLPANRLESLKGALQWSFMVSEKAATTLALGYLHEFKLADLNRWGKDNAYKGNVFNPFFVAAKCWNRHYHTLIYTGPKIFQSFKGDGYLSYEINTSFHYMPYNTRHFVGIEVNQDIHAGNLNTVLRPQLRIEFTESLLIGCVTAIPVNMPHQGIGTFIRIIYEPH